MIMFFSSCYLHESLTMECERVRKLVRDIAAYDDAGLLGIEWKDGVWMELSGSERMMRLVDSPTDFTGLRIGRVDTDLICVAGAHTRWAMECVHLAVANEGSELALTFVGGCEPWTPPNRQLLNRPARETP